MSVAADSPHGQSPSESLPGLAPADATLPRIAAAIRIVLAFAAVHVTIQLTDSPVPHGLALFYAVYALVLYTLALRRSVPVSTQGLFWGDALWFLLMSGATGGPLSVFVMFLFFPILVVAFGWGMRRAVALAIACAAFLLLLGLAGARQAAPVPLDHVAAAVVLVAVLGYFVADLAGLGVDMKARLALIQRLGTLADPRLGMEGSMARVLEEMSAHFGADICAVLLSDSEMPARLVKLDAGQVRSLRLDAQTEQHLSALGGGVTVVYNSGSRWRCGGVRLYAHDPGPGRPVRADPERSAELANLLECGAFISAPLRRHGSAWGRIFVGKRRRCFTIAEAHLLSRLMEQLAPAWENIRLQERLLGDAARQEREKIGRDLHDSAIQPYVGLKFGLEALARKASSSNGLKPEIDRLAEMVNHEIGALRSLLGELGGRRREGSQALAPAIRRHAARFAELYGISVEVDFACEETIDDEVCGEIFHMVTEGLSNVGRHTRAQSATVGLSCRGGWLQLQVVNRHDGGAAPRAFNPASIAERARQLGGRAEVRIGAEETAVIVSIPCSRSQENVRMP